MRYALLLALLPALLAAPVAARADNHVVVAGCHGPGCKTTAAAAAAAAPGKAGGGGKAAPPSVHVKCSTTTGEFVLRVDEAGAPRGVRMLAWCC